MAQPLDELYVGYSDSMVMIARTIYSELLNQHQKSVDNPNRKQRLAKLTVAVMNRLSRELGGDSYYITKTNAMELTERNWAMFNEFNGRNYKELSKKYGMTNAHTRKIINACQRKRYSERQMSLLESSID